MRCFVCNEISFATICHRCRRTLLVPSVSLRRVGTLRIYSLFSYATIEALLLTKHKSKGFRIYRAFGKYYLKPFLHDLQHRLAIPFYVVGIDEKIASGYSHIAQLTHCVHSRNIRVEHGVLTARNNVRYAGKSLAYRLEHPRDFRYTGEKENIVLVDDVVTTGTTLHEAAHRIEQSGGNVLFAVVLADADRR